MGGAKGERRRDLGPTLAAQLHDISAGLAVGIGLLKSVDSAALSDSSPAIGILEAVLGDLKEIAPFTRRVRRGHGHLELASGLRKEAARLGVELELDLVGDSAWLAVDQIELLRLAGREAIRNVARHSGAAKCRMTIDVSDCPFVLRARDWGAGINPEAKVGNGIRGLRDLATSIGCELAVGSQPGLGTVLVLAGQRCPRTLSGRVEPAQLRSVVAD